MPPPPRSTPTATPPCPRCNATQTVHIVYGMPDEDLMREAQRGAVKLAGCLVGDDDPRWHCRACGAEWA